MSAYAKLSEKLTFPIPWYAHIRTCAYQRVRNISFSENFAHVLNRWSLKLDLNTPFTLHFSWKYSIKIGENLIKLAPTNEENSFKNTRYLEDFYQLGRLNSQYVFYIHNPWAIYPCVQRGLKFVIVF